MRKVKFNSCCTMKGTGWFHKFESSPYGPMAVVEIIEGEGDQISETEVMVQSNHWNENKKEWENTDQKPGWAHKYEVRPFEKGQVVTCSASGITFIDDAKEKPYNYAVEANKVCVCGHDKSKHIYYEGACRPGFLCKHECKKFIERE